jgi:hypothetical protein
MRNLVRDWLREFRATQVIRAGEKLNSLHALRHGLDPMYHADEIQRIDLEIDRLERRRDAWKAKIARAVTQGGVL